MNNLITEKIKLWGVVQGVGFRPFILKLAIRLGLKGRVLNMGGLVQILVTDNKENIDQFIDIIKKEKPQPAEIVHIKRERVDYIEFDSFSILDSNEGDEEAAMIPADLSICKTCTEELKNPKDPRFEHPFISCMVCGPRYTIIDKIPYDRKNTNMDEFPMCDFCHLEYTDKSHRRYHAQTISCKSCGPQLELMNSNGKPIDEAARLLKDGNVIGFKSVGGYNLVCDPLNDSAARILRRIKNREKKPFAIMFKDLKMLKSYCQCSQEEENLLNSSAKPIVLLEKKSWDDNDEPEELKKSRFIGAFLPSFGAQILLIEKFGGPLVFTSANISNMPMIKDDEEMREFVNASEGMISECIFHKRKINVRVDDSVVRVIDSQPQMIRRSKGYVPVPLHINSESINREKTDNSIMILSLGGQLKNSFSLGKGPFSYISQYFGDLDNLENCQIFEENIERMKSLFRISPNLVVCDMHPNYMPSMIGKRYAENNNISVLKAQHHHAHVASVMAEHGIEDEIIGVSLDGTGYGSDGKIWGGEILLCNKDEFRRISHLKYIKMIGGDGSVKEAWKSAMCYTYDHINNCSFDRLKEDEFSVDVSDIIDIGNQANVEGWTTIKAALDNSINTIESSSMGRLFDAVSSLLGICQINEYEGQCAIMLEDAAARSLKNPKADKIDDLALDFHYRVADAVVFKCEEIRQKEKVNKVALTGGVFQNKILMERCLELLRIRNFQVYYNISVSPNDGGIGLGQNYIGLHHQIKSKNKKIDKI